MATRTQDTFQTIKTEGAILPPDLLRRIADGDKDLDGLTPESFHLAKSERLNEAAARAWNRLQGAWESFRVAMEKLPDSDVGTTLTRERWLLILFQELGYGRLTTHKAYEIGGKTYPVSHAWQATPIHLVSFRLDLDRRERGVAGAARVSPHSLVQEFLNRSDDHLWGFLSNGLTLRILRDNASLSRQAYVEFDLQAMMDSEAYSDFFLLYLLCHQSRVEVPEDKTPEHCWLERWYNTAARQGVRALDALRDGVQKAIEALGAGFLAHPGNKGLREKLRAGELSTQEYYRQVLRQVYRMLFLFVAEDRGLLLDPEAPDEAKRLYATHYSTRRLRDLARKTRGTRHPDLWRALRLVFGKLHNGCSELALPALGSFLFRPDATAALNDADTANSHLLAAVRHLAFTVDRHVLRPVDYRNLGSEELGSVYESLLEMHPQINTEAATFALDIAAGSERKTTGSYYTPSSLVNCLLDSALDPVLEEACKAKDPEKALLDLKICDPACGSGHFLISAAHRLAKRLAAVRAGEDEPAPESVRQALRDVIGRCIYGVDINPDAVELCKFNLWVDALEPGRPLSFLDHHVQCGNSLLGTTPALLAQGIPDDAFKPITGDDKEVCKALKRENKDERRGQRALFGEAPWDQLGNLPQMFARLEFEDDSDLAAVEKKERHYYELVRSAAYENASFLADGWCAAFVWPKTSHTEPAVTTDVIRRIAENPHHYPEGHPIREGVRHLSHKYQLFHWHLAFPDVFRLPAEGETPENEETGWSGGFDVVLGNPPWDMIQLDDAEFFATARPDIASAPTTAKRKQAINSLAESDPQLFSRYKDAMRRIHGIQHVIHNSGVFSLTAAGRLNSAPLFCEWATEMVGPTGRVGMIAPTSVVTTSFTQAFFSYLTRAKRIVSLYDFENSAPIFPSVHRNYKFSLLTISGRASPAEEAAFAFYCTDVSDLKEPARTFALTSEDVSLLNPNTGTCPIFRSAADAHLTELIYRRLPILSKDEADGRDMNPWAIRFFLMFMMNTASHLFHNPNELEDDGWTLVGNRYVKDDTICLPLYEGKMIWQHNHRASSVEYKGGFVRGRHDVSETLPEQLRDPAHCAQPRMWVAEEEVLRAAGQHSPFFVCFRDITNASAERTRISTVIPWSAVGNKLPILFLEGKNGLQCSAFVGESNSFVADFALRQKIPGNNLNYYILRQLPQLPPAAYEECERFVDISLLWWVGCRALELLYNAWDLEAFARDCGYDGPPFIWDEERRFLTRCELDAAFFHLYLGSPEEWEEQGTPELIEYFPTPRDAVDYIMDTFPIVKKKDEKAHSTYRTKDTILEIYDEMAEAIRTGHPYQTRLDPPPGPPCDTQGNFLPLPEWKPGQPRPATWPTHIHPPREVVTVEEPRVRSLVFTVGHSNVSVQKWLSLLREHEIQVLVDVRSVPYSRHVPEANRESLEAAVKAAGMKYLFMGDQLGGRPRDVSVTDESGKPDYSQLAATSAFQEGMTRLLKGAAEYRVCLLCSEEDPSQCHRGLLISMELAERGVEVRHIRRGGRIESQANLEKRLPTAQKGLFREKDS